MPMLIHCPSVSVSCALRGKSAQIMANVNNNLFITLFHLSAAKVRVYAGFSVTTFSCHMFIFSVSLRGWISNVCPTFSARHVKRGLSACKRPPFTLRLTAFCTAKGRISHLHRINKKRMYLIFGTSFHFVMQQQHYFFLFSSSFGIFSFIPSFTSTMPL